MIHIQIVLFTELKESVLQVLITTYPTHKSIVMQCCIFFFLFFLLHFFGKKCQPKVFISKKNALFSLVVSPEIFRHTYLCEANDVIEIFILFSLNLVTFLLLPKCQYWISEEIRWALNFIKQIVINGLNSKQILQDYSYFSQENLKDSFHISSCNGILDGKKIIRTIQLIIPLH